MAPQTATEIPFGRVLQILGFTHSDTVGILEIPPGGRPNARTISTRAAVRWNINPTVHTYYGANPLTTTLAAGKRGTADDIARIGALLADFDIKPGSFDTLDQAKACAAEIGITVSTKPAILAHSGGGLHALWPTERPIAAAQLRRWHKLVQAHADKHGAKVDNISDPARVLRMPGSLNHKFDPPRPCIAYEQPGAKPVPSWALDAALDHYAPLAASVTEIAAGTPEDAELPSGHTDWDFADETCAFMRTFIRTVVNDTPTARHPWLLSQYVKMTCAVANGCITAEDHAEAVRRVNNRMRVLTGLHPVRPFDPDEIRDAARHAITVVERKTPTQITAELGGHIHENPLTAMLKGHNR